MPVTPAKAGVSGHEGARAYPNQIRSPGMPGLATSSLPIPDSPSPLIHSRKREMGQKAPEALDAGIVPPDPEIFAQRRRDAEAPSFRRALTDSVIDVDCRGNALRVATAKPLRASASLPEKYFTP
jgi:hypothetical protein